jgi:hypothetical protein
LGSQDTGRSYNAMIRHKWKLQYVHWRQGGAAMCLQETRKNDCIHKRQGEGTIRLQETRKIRCVRVRQRKLWCEQEFQISTLRSHKIGRSEIRS